LGKRRLGEKETWGKGDLGKRRLGEKVTWRKRDLEKKGLGDLEKRKLVERKPEVVCSLWFVLKSEG
jgi:hypothetical protein